MKITIPFVDDALDHSIIYEEYKGDFAQARQIAEEQLQSASQQNTPTLLADALLARGVVHLLQGEPPAAMHCFQQITQVVPNDPTRHLRAVNYSNLANYYQFNRFPDENGAGGAELAQRWNGEKYVEEFDQYHRNIASHVNDPAAHFEAATLKLFLTAQQSARAFLRSGKYSSNMNLTQSLIQAALHISNNYLQTAQSYAAEPSYFAYAHLAAADFYQRNGNSQSSVQTLERAQQIYQQSNDYAGIATCHMKHGDALSAPFSTPLVWNLAIQEGSSSGSELAWTWETAEFKFDNANLDRAAVKYDEAERFFKAATAPRGLANIYLRRAYLAMLKNQWDQALAAINQAIIGFEACGDLWGYYLAQTHQLLLKIGAGQFPEDRATASKIGAWGNTTGSFSFTLGLGLLMGRVGRHWLIRMGDYERALACYRLGEALYQALGPHINLAQTVEDQGGVYQTVGARMQAVPLYEAALDQYETIVTTPSIPAQQARKHLIMLANDVYQLYKQKMEPDGMERSIRRLQKQVPSGGGVLGALGAGLSALSSDGSSGTNMELLALNQLASSLIDEAKVLIPLYKARQAQKNGQQQEANHLFAQARNIARATGGAQGDLLEAQVLGHQKAYPEARQAFQRYLDQGGANAGFVGKLAKILQTFGGEHGQMEAQRQDRRTLELAMTFLGRVKAFEEAERYLQQLHQVTNGRWWQDDERPWLTLSDSGEIYEGLGNTKTALRYYNQAIEALESRRSSLSRDELKTAMAADLGAQFLYFMAARTALKRAIASTSESEAQQMAASAHAYAERGKARALLDLMVDSTAGASSAAGDGDTIRTWRQENARLTIWQGLLAQRAEQTRSQSTKTSCFTRADSGNRAHTSSN